MEDPIQFDLWCAPSKADKPWLIENLELPAQTEAQRLRAIASAVRLQQPILFRAALGWAEAVAQRSRLLTAGVDSTLYQAGYGPEDAHRLSQCPIHNAFYGGCLGCPVCGSRAAP